MLAAYLKKHSPDGEIIFLAANPDLKIKGIGTKLLTEFEKERKEKKYSFLQIAAVRINSMNDVDLKD